jgi:hypothetical protein
MSDLSIPIRSIRSIKPTGNQIHVSAVGDFLWVGAIPLAAPQAQTVRVDEVQVEYETEMAPETSSLERNRDGTWKKVGIIALGMGDVGFLIKHVEQNKG